MKRNTLLLLLLLGLAVVAIIGTQIYNSNNEDDELIVVRLNEVVHSIFYAPQYVALEKGFFEEEGLLIELSVGQGADRSMVALISRNTDIALMGTEAAIYVYNEGREDHSIAFAQLTQRAGNYLISRTENEDFSWEDVRGKKIIGGRLGGMPQMVLEYILTKNGIIPGKDVEIITNLQFTSTAGAFISGIGDFTIEFDPSALAVEQTGQGHIVRGLGTDSGIIPYTVYMAQKSYIEENPEIIQKFTNAIYRGQQWFFEHSAREVAELISVHFEEHTIDELELMIERYIAQDVFSLNPILTEEGFYTLQNIMDLSGELSNRIEFNSLINNSFAEEAIRN